LAVAISLGAKGVVALIEAYPPKVGAVPAAGSKPAASSASATTPGAAGGAADPDLVKLVLYLSEAVADDINSQQTAANLRHMAHALKKKYGL
jgi:hypothetical protein